MSTLTTRRAAATTAFEPTTAAASYSAAGASSQALITEAISCIIAGRAFPEHLRPAAFASAPQPRTIEEGIARILRS